MSAVGPRLRRRGATAIEFAIWLPVLLMFIASVIDYGMYMTRRVAIARAAMEGARLGAAVFEPDTVVPPGSRIKSLASARAQQTLSEMGIQCDGGGACSITPEYCQSPSATGNACGGPPFDAIQITIHYDFVPIFGLVPVPGEITERQLMAVENQK